MQIGKKIQKGLVNILLISALVGCGINSDKKNYLKEGLNIELKDSLSKITGEKLIKKYPLESVEEYDSFVRSTINKNYVSDVKEVYNFFNIKRDLPKYGFKGKAIQIVCLDCTGGVYKEKSDSIYFYSSCSKEMFNRFRNYHKDNKEDIGEYLTRNIHHYIKHEAAHAFYYDLGKNLGADYLFNIEYNSPSVTYNLQHTLVEEGVAEYIAYEGELTPSANRMNDKNFDSMVKEENDYMIYNLGFILVKPILDKNFEKGVIELIKNPLKKDDLNDLPGYREKILKKLE